MRFLNVRLLLLLCLTLGLAPYRPEPQLVKCYRVFVDPNQPWEGAHTLDLLFHGIPWILLIAALVARYRARNASPDQTPN